MKKRKNTMTYTAKELKKLHSQGASQTNWDKVDSISDKELDKIIKSEENIDDSIPKDWFVGMPQKKERISINLDEDVLKWFRNKGSGYQTYINNILRSYISLQQKH